MCGGGANEKTGRQITELREVDNERRRESEHRAGFLKFKKAFSVKLGLKK